MSLGLTREPADGLPDLASVLAGHGLDGVPEEPLQHDGWSGAVLTRLTRADGRRFVLKRDSLARDWIARVTGDPPTLREAQLVAAAPRLPWPVGLPHVAAARDGDGIALLMPDLTGTLLAWESPVDGPTANRVIDALATLHAAPWHDLLPPDFPWTDLRKRVTLLTPTAAAAYAADGNPVGARFQAGWKAFGRHAPAAAGRLIRDLDADPGPLLAALRRLPAGGLHGDLKLGNVGLATDGTVWMIDWQMTLVAPVAVELGWFMVCNVAGLPLAPQEVLDRYRAAAGRPADQAWAAERDLAVVVGLLLRGWRKGLDAEAGLTLPTRLTARDDLAWWAAEAIAAAERLL